MAKNKKQFKDTNNITGGSNSMNNNSRKAVVNTNAKAVNLDSKKSTEGTTQASRPVFDPSAFLCHYGTSVEEAKEKGKSISYLIGKDAQVYEMRKNEVGSFIAKADEIKGKGACQEVSYGFSEDGGKVYEIRKNSNGATFINEVNRVDSADTISETFELNVPQIPFEFLLQTTAFFRDVAKEVSNDEAMLEYWYDKEKEEYFIVCPKQTTTTTNVHFERDRALDEDPNKIRVMDIHSHNTMSAFFSATDDSSEQETRIYGVIGRVDKDKVEYKFRYSVAGKFKLVNIFDFFERPTIKVSIGNYHEQEMPLSEDNIMFPRVDYPNEWLEKVKEGKRLRNEILSKRKTYKPTTNYNKPSGLGSGLGGGLTGGGYGRQIGFFGEEDDFGYGQSASSFKKDPNNKHLPTPKMDTYLDDSDLVFSGDGFDWDNDPEENVEAVFGQISNMSLFEIRLLVERFCEYGYDYEMVEQLKNYGYNLRK